MKNYLTKFRSYLAASTGYERRKLQYLADLGLIDENEQAAPRASRKPRKKKRSKEQDEE